MIDVRPLQASDVQYVRSLLANEEINAALHAGDQSRWGSDPDPDERNFILCCDDAPVGWLKLNGLLGDKAWISMLVIEPRFQWQGIGTFAVRWGEEFVYSLGLKKIAVRTTADNLPARACYEKLGYVLVKKGKYTTGDCVRRKGWTFEKELNSILYPTANNIRRL